MLKTKSIATVPSTNKYDGVITIEIPIMAIVEKLASTINPTFEHTKLLVDTIMSLVMKNNDLNYLYNALNGFTNTIDFEIGQWVDCKEKVYKYLATSTDEIGTKTSYEEKYLEIGFAQIISIDLYKSDKLLVKFEALNSKGEIKEFERWVSHISCSGIESPM